MSQKKIIKIHPIIKIFYFKKSLINNDKNYYYYYYYYLFDKLIICLIN